MHIRYKNKKDLIIFFSLLVISFILILSYYRLSTWHATHWLFSIQEGFYSRALVGSIIQAILPNQFGSFGFINVASFILVIILSTIMVTLCYKYWTVNKNYFGLLISLIFISSTGTIRFYASDGARFDNIGYIIIILVAYNYSIISKKLQLMLICLASIFLVLIHEALILLNAPILFAVYLIERINDGKTFGDAVKVLVPLTVSIAPAFILALIILISGKLEYSSILFEQKLSSLQDIANFIVSAESLMVQFRTINDNVLYTINDVFRFSSIVHIIFSTISLIPSLIVGYIFLSKTLIKMKNSANDLYSKTLHGLIVFCCSAPLILFFIALDYPRWMAAVVANLFLVGMLTSLKNKLTIDNLFFITSKETSYYLYTFIIIFSLSIGPIPANPYNAPIPFNRIIEMVPALLNYIF